MGFNGQFFCVVVFVFFVFASAASLLALRLPEAAARLALAIARSAVQVATILSVILLCFLVWSFYSNNFSLDAVAHYSSTTLPLGYKISAVWAGAAGSLLVWAVILYVMMAVWTNKTKDTPFDTTAMAIGSIMCAGFAAFLAFVSKPLALSPVVSQEGASLNPLLQNFWMVIHPPLLFIGYSGFLVPFAMILAAVFTGEFGSAEFHRTIRRWFLFAFCFLTLGIATGAKWAYVVLGWGGFWGWDPVENASLLPWLAALAALHSLAATRRAGKYRVWTVGLVGAPFLLCLVATFITRSGVLQSVHAFGANPMGTALLIMLGFVCGLWLVAIITAGIRLTAKPSSAEQGWIAGGGLSFITNLVLIFTIAAVAIGTFWPVISSALSGASVAPSRGFYDRISSVTGITLVVLVMVCGFLNWQANKRVRSAGVVAAHLGLIVLVIAAGVGAYGEKDVEVHLAKGVSQTIGGYEFTYISFQQTTSGEKIGVGPQVILRRGDMKETLWPHTGIYGNEQRTTEVAVHSGLFEDVYITFGGIDESNKAQLTVLFKPMMNWLWAAMLLITLGAAWMWLK
jgi:cytochrome c-type biogenesis protein CcmF